MPRILALLIGFFCLGSGPGEEDDDIEKTLAALDEPDPNAADDPDKADDPDADPDKAEDADDPDKVDDPAETKRQLQAERTARQKAEREAADARAQAEALRTRAPGPAAVDPEQKAFEEEERKLADPNTSPMDKWTINSNRELRAARRESRSALQEAQEIRDKGDYERLCAQNSPAGRLAKKYEPKVESKLAEMRASGKNLDRRFVLKMIVGDEIVEGKVKTSKKAADGGERKPVDRNGKPTPRTDVRPGAGKNEREARRKRLDGVQL